MASTGNISGSSFSSEWRQPLCFCFRITRGMFGTVKSYRGLKRMLVVTTAHWGRHGVSWQKWLLSQTFLLAAKGGTAAWPCISRRPFTKAVQMGCSGLGACPDLAMELGALFSHFLLDSSWRFFAISDPDGKVGSPGLATWPISSIVS